MGRIQTKRLVVFDLETTGLEPERDSVIQVGAVALDGQLSPCGEFESKLRFEGGRAAAAALEVNSFEQGVWDREAISEGEAAKRFAAFLHEHATLPRTGVHGKPFLVAQLASYNSGFDSRFLHAWFERVGQFLPADRRVLCLMQRAHWALVESHGCSFPENLKLGTICQELGIPLGQNAHDAIHDARAAASLYRMLHGLTPIAAPEPAGADLANEALRYRSGRRSRRKSSKHTWRRSHAGRAPRRRRSRMTV